MMRFNVGDIVRVKDWDVLVKEFGYNECGYDIETPCYFLEEMKEFCGKTFTISEVINVKKIKQDINIPDNTFAYYFTNDEDRYYFDECVLETVILTNKIRDMVKEIEDMRAQLYQKLDYRMGKVEICHELFSIQYRLEIISHTIAYYENVE